MDETLRVDEEAEADRIDALEAALDAIDPNTPDRRTRETRDRLYRELSAARTRRIERRTETTWQRLEALVGHKLRR